jgi:hypothetical protein
MAEAMERKILGELASVKSKLSEMDKELHGLREDFADTHLTEEERKKIADALAEEKEGKTTSLAEMKKQLGF